MFFQLLYIHLFRPFLKYNPNNSPLPAHVSPRKHCTTAAAQISKLLRLYKRSHGLRQIPNIVVYIAHSACTIHLLNLPEKNAKRDIIHGVKHLEEIAEGWLCARRTLGILSVLVKRWKVELPEEATAVLTRTDEKFGPWSNVSTPKPTTREPQPIEEHHLPQTSPALQPYSISLANTATQFFDRSGNPMTSMSAGLHRARNSEARSLPPNDENPLAYPRQQPDYASPATTTNNPVTPASTAARQSIDGGTSTNGNSPSQLFGGVEQLIREGQDWWLRDQNQLAVGFDNWNYNAEDIASWFASQGGVGSPGQQSNGVQGFTAGTSPVLEGGAVGGGVNGGMNGGVAGYDGGFNGYPNESEWYQ
jgi:hypothetical protein